MARKFLSGVDLGGNKAVNVANGTTSTDTAAFGQIPPSVRPLPILLPAYQYPTAGTMWPVLTATEPVVAYAVADPADGPGSSADSNYTAAISAAQAAGVRILGYVDTNFAAVAISTVQVNVGLWDSVYGITDIFFDNVSSGSGDLPYYETATGYVAGMTVLNHGTIPDPGYGPLGTILNVFESPLSSWTGYSPPSWFSDYEPSKFCAIVYGIPAWPEAAAVADQIRAAGIGNFFLSDQSDYTQMPSWWQQEVDLGSASFSNYVSAADPAVTVFQRMFTV